jgi:hypothetical protein
MPSVIFDAFVKSQKFPPSASSPPARRGTNGLFTSPSSFPVIFYLRNGSRFVSVRGGFYLKSLYSGVPERLDRLIDILTKIEQPLLFSSREGYKHLPLVKEL